MRVWVFASITFLAFEALVFGQAAERKVKVQDVPLAVQQAVKEQGKNATLVGMTTEMENGRRVYEAEFKADGRGKDVTFDARGEIVSVEEEVDLASLPSPASAAIRTAAGSAKIVLVEHVTEGASTFYEAHISRRGKLSEFKVDSSGNPVK